MVGLCVASPLHRANDRSRMLSEEGRMEEEGRKVA